MPIDLLEHLKSFEDHRHIHSPNANLNVGLHRVKAGSKFLSICINDSLVLTFLSNIPIFIGLQLYLHLLPYSQRSVEIFFIVIEINQHLIRVRIHLDIELFKKRKNKALYFVLLESICVDLHCAIQNLSVEHAFGNNLFEKFPSIGQHKFSILFRNLRNETGTGINFDEIVVGRHSRLNILYFHDLNQKFATLTIYTADLRLAVVEQAFKAYWMVSLLTIYPASTISKNLSTTRIEYYGLVARALKQLLIVSSIGFMFLPRMIY